jgi:hypothetical protein
MFRSSRNDSVVNLLNDDRLIHYSYIQKKDPLDNISLRIGKRIKIPAGGGCVLFEDGEVEE